MAQGDTADNFESINRELRLFSPKLLEKPQAVAGTKTDIQGNGQRLDRLRQYCKDKGYDFFPLCSITGKGVKELVQYLGRKVEELKIS